MQVCVTVDAYRALVRMGLVEPFEGQVHAEYGHGSFLHVPCIL